MLALQVLPNHIICGIPSSSWRIAGTKLIDFRTYSVPPGPSQNSTAPPPDRC